VIFLTSAHEGDALRFQQRREASPLGRRDGHILDIRGTLPDGRVSVLARLATEG